jgi:MFS transporter, ACS family, tartrate transporter
MGTLTDIEQAIHRRAVKKIAWRLLPILIVSFLLSQIDRSNVSIAALTMNKDIGLTATQFGYGAGIFFLSYALFEVPSNLVLHRVGARRWLARIMITWGLCSAAMMFVRGPTSFYVLRFLLGLAEAGFFPGVAIYLSGWFSARYRARVFAWFLASIPAAPFIGNPISGLLLGLNGFGGLAGWQWMFLLQGLPCVLLGPVLLRALTDRPEDAAWLTAEERRLVRCGLEEEQRGPVVTNFLPALRDVRVLLMSAMFLSLSIGSYGLLLWLPFIVKQQQSSNAMVGLLSGLPYLAGIVGMIVWGTVVDRHGRHVVHLAATCLVGAIGFAVAVISANFAVALLGMAVAAAGVNAARPVLWAIPPRFLAGAAAAGGIAFINSIGQIGGFLGPTIMGWLKDTTGSFTVGLATLAGCLVLAAVFAACLGFVVRDE